MPSVPDPRIDDGVQQIHGEIGDTDQRGEYSEYSNGDVVVAAGDAADKLLAQAWDSKDVLDDHAAGDDADEEGPQDAGHGDHGIAQGMPQGHDTGLESLRPRGAD